MKKFIIMFAAIVAMFLVSANYLHAQGFDDGGGLLVTEDSLLSPSHKQVVFVVAKDILQPVKIEMQTQTLDGIFNQFRPLQFPQGVKRGQIIPIWNGDLNSFSDTPWFSIWVTMSTEKQSYYMSTMFPVNYQEQYKEPMITSISETGGYGVPYVITAKVIYDTTVPTEVLINTNLFVLPRAVTQIRPGVLQITMPNGNFDRFSPGKYLLTICQETHCDTLEGRHR